LSTKRYPYLDWVMRPISNTVKGFSLFSADLGRTETSQPKSPSAVLYWILWVLFYFFFSFIKVPVHNNAPLRSSPPKGEKPTQWPIVIFSPGLACQLTTASHTCARIASTGKVVIVMDHRDGTGVATYPRNPDTGKKETLLYVPEAASSHGAEPGFAFRKEQLDFRRFEIYSAWDALKKLVVDGDRGKLTSMDDVPIDWAAFYEKIDFSSVQFVGHSFGGATLFHVLSTSPDDGFSTLPISHALFLDPWLLPFSKPDPKPINPGSGTKTLILHSEEFTLHKPGFLDRMLEVRPFWSNPPTYTIARTKHICFNDYMLILPERMRGTASLTARKAGDLIIGFLDEHFEETLSGCTIREFVSESIEDKKGRTTVQLVAEPGDLITH